MLTKKSSPGHVSTVSHRPLKEHYHVTKETKTLYRHLKFLFIVDESITVAEDNAVDENDIVLKLEEALS